MKPFQLYTAVVAILGIFGGGAYCGTPSDDHGLSADLKRLDGLSQVFLATQARNDQFGYEFTLASKRLADERGPEVIRAVMHLSRKWRGEEGLVYIPLIDFLPRKAALKLLHQYEHSENEFVRINASDFLAEVEMYTAAEAEKNLKDRFSQWPYKNSFPK